MTTRIPLSKGYFALVDDEDAKRISKHSWCALVRTNTVYASRTIRLGRGAKAPKRSIAMHREVLGATDGQLVDHKNRDGLDNRKENLRLATKRLNVVNTSNVKSSTGFKGVKKWRRRFVARIATQDGFAHLGSFATPEEAAAKYDEAALAAYGEFAVTNVSLGLLP